MTLEELDEIAKTAKFQYGNKDFMELSDEELSELMGPNWEEHMNELLYLYVKNVVNSIPVDLYKTYITTNLVPKYNKSVKNIAIDLLNSMENNTDNTINDDAIEMAFEISNKYRDDNFSKYKDGLNLLFNLAYIIGNEDQVINFGLLHAKNALRKIIKEESSNETTAKIKFKRLVKK